jgi:hypothetical protein
MTGPVNVASVVDACSASVRSWKSGRLKPSPLYHLTDTEGAKAIVTSKTLRASLATSLNDATEVEHGRQLAIEVVRERLIQQPSFGYYRSLLRYLLDPTAAPPLDRIEIFPLVISLCGRCDRSGQWLHYGRQGRGIALGFDVCIEAATRFELVEVDYSLSSHRLRMASLVDVGASLCTGPLSVEHVAHLVSLYVTLLAIRLKHPSFVEEDEWRLVAARNYQEGALMDLPEDRRPLDFREQPDRLVPYETVHFDAEQPSLLREAVVGFSSSVGPDAFRLVLLDNGFNCPVRRSEVPVR